MIIRNIFSIIGLVIATILGVYAQDISYFLNDTYSVIEATTFITLVTFISIGLYIFIPLQFVFQNNDKKKLFAFYLITSALIGIPTSLWSIFVWGMWMG
ncbi:hypothetical protein [Aquibacillus sediminis]|uniref:hypothetical protein n=1 Tax=Aquibacillus sediminis TaxID=2574734 RepID=UPI0011082894|nr:hypothetical protein [Aquibacillus sediminis]